MMIDPFHRSFINRTFGLDTEDIEQLNRDVISIREEAAELDLRTREGWDSGAKFLGELVSFQMIAERISGRADGSVSALEEPVIHVASDGEELFHDEEVRALLIASENGSRMQSTASGSTFSVGQGADIVAMAGGRNLVVGGAAELDNDELQGFDETDLILTRSEAFTISELFGRLGSAILGADLDGDGSSNFEIRLAGEFDIESFGVMPAPDGTAIFYRSPPPDLVASVGGTVTDRSGNPLADVDLHLHRPFGAVKLGDTNTEGRIEFNALLGTEGSLNATAEAVTTRGDITARDALDVLRLAVGLEPSWGPAAAEDFIAADINRDGQVTAVDALEVLRHAVGLQSEHAPQWVFIDADADLRGIDRDNVEYETGVDFVAFNAEHQLSMTGILTGSMQEYA